MKESEFVGSLLPTHPDLYPIVDAMREKYRLREVELDGEPIQEIFLENEILPLEEFWHEIRLLVEQNASYLPEQLIRAYEASKKISNLPPESVKDFELLPEHMKDPFKGMIGLLQNLAKPWLTLLEKHFTNITNMLYTYILTGETEEIPADWISNVGIMEFFGNRVVIAGANQLADPEIIVQQFRQVYAKTFGKHRPKLTNNVVSTAYYMQLRRLGKPWDFIVEEFIRRNKFSLPRDRGSKRYFEVRRKYAQLLKKRIQRSEIVLNIFVGDKKK